DSFDFDQVIESAKTGAIIGGVIGGLSAVPVVGPTIGNAALIGLTVVGVADGLESISEGRVLSGIVKIGLAVAPFGVKKAIGKVKESNMSLCDAQKQ
ncbi:MAG: hypothetical protein MN733_16660, partial [Nitrososphaera sp.]|nr:hypothetical protein [Nitrososphaera sp.]